MELIYTKHAKEMLVFRSIEKRYVEQCIEAPDKVLPAREGKSIYLKNFGKNYLKVVISQVDEAIVIVTVYWLAKKRVKK